MVISIAGSLDAISSTVFWIAAFCLIALNGAALAAFVITRSRRLVDEWTPRLVAADAMLLSAGLGVPMIAALVKMGVGAVAAMLGAGPAPVR